MRSSTPIRIAALLFGLRTVASSVINLNEVCLTPIATILYGHLGVCGAPSNLQFLEEEDYAPWTTKPQCLFTQDSLDGIDEHYCIFSNKNFADGRGITFITTPAIAAEVVKEPAFAKPDSIKGMNDLVNPPWGPPAYEMRPLPGRGFGMIANRTIFRGERLMQETPTFVYNRNMFTMFDDQDRIPLHWHGAYLLPKETREELLALHKHHGGDEVDDLMRTNAFGAYFGEPYVLHNNVLPRISRFNHDCRPNAHYYFDKETMTQYVHAVRTINPGEEILVNYTDAEHSSIERQHAIHLSWGFTCSCSICRQPETHVAASDARLRLIKALKEKLNDWTEDQPARAQMAETLIQLYQQERLDVPIATAYESAAYAYAIEGDEFTARKYAALAVESMTILYGASHPLTLDLEVMMLDPTQHRTWHYRVPKKEVGEGQGGENDTKVEGKEGKSDEWSFF
ncbi:SET domain-containing protein [Venturia nashicola]|uniref:SET domain-containing protein n=1 Tax=Venturia nashicola TaxID=86259 RepID=A0A4Z1P2S9_9PEZI|nr:SET domain-containing protein [Venturia nashicola]